ncbi:class I SAM-dependent methyltransferase [Maledivibacter halophilus]|uniref:Methyltransferase domain-containing protein n=1 Tax=Maledivibacter halophilus TaxID=36842 RepID=A0A1T5L9X2_9FIRM|nr:class I SAM-dependent methyltransferase [Maledivibacter halophilus]SKC72459.1 Methyltransferase domain-containing protein [Maledivibacter halophilus]
MDKNYFIKKLEERKIDLQESKARWDKRAEEFYSYSKDIKEKEDNTIKFLKQFMDLNGKSVLDVGFGAGKYLVLLWNQGAKLKGVELSHKMMEYAKSNCIENGIDMGKIELFNIPWEEIDIDELNWRNKFDLVFASMSPVLDSYESIQKLISASRKSVFCSTHINMKEDLLAELYREIHGKEYEFSRDKFWYIYNILYLEGFYPSVKIMNKKKRMELTIDEALYRYVNRIFPQNPSKEELSILRKSIEKRGVGGKVSINMERKNALIYFEK